MNENFKHTPSTLHYVFSIRETNKIFRALLLANNESITTHLQFLKLWTHECNRIYQDRLKQNDIAKYEDIISQVHDEIFKQKTETISNGFLYFGNFYPQQNNNDNNVEQH